MFIKVSMQTESEILKSFISKVEDGQIQSKYLVTIQVNSQLLYWKEIYYDIEKSSVIDAFIMGRWNYEPGTIILINVFDIPSSAPSAQYEIIFLQSGIEVVTKK